jgi:signal peptidase II
MFYLAALSVAVFDQLIKFIVNSSLRPGGSIPVIRNILNLTYVQNRGAAWGIFPGQNWLLLGIAVAVVGLLFYYHFKLSRGDIMQLGLGLVLGGVLGNSLDRFFRHFVIDFVDFIIWPVFNLADMMIDLGVAILLFRLFFSKEEKNAAGPF